MYILSALFALVLASAHALAAYFKFIHLTPRTRWLSFASGVSVSFVFLKLLPYLHDADLTLRDVGDQPLAHALALTGLVAFYGLEVAVRISRRHRGEPDSKPSPGMFILHLSAFAGYNALLGAIVVDQIDQAVSQQVLFVLALLLHNMVNDFSLREHHQQEYQRFGRWVLAASLLLGWAIAAVVDIPDAIFFSLVALLAGAIILNVLKEELPTERESRIGAFLTGCLLYALLWLLTGWV